MIMIFLACCFGLQTMLVYIDPLKAEPLSDTAIDGRRVWHRHNCQSCHQLYGFGGFLGPDLTNAAGRLVPSRLEAILTDGSGAMPALHLSAQEIAAVGQFLIEMDRTGRGQAVITLADGTDFNPVLALASAIAKVGGEQEQVAQRGFELMKREPCFTCHYPFVESSKFPNLLKLRQWRSQEEVLEMLRTGSPPDMPKPRLTEDERVSVAQFLAWTAEHESELLKHSGMDQKKSINWMELPWWEYR